MRKLCFIASLVPIGVAAVVPAGPAAASELEPVVLRRQGDWWLGMDAGAGAVGIEFPEGRISENKFYLGVRAEYVFNPKWVAGIEASGWLIRPGEIEYNTLQPPANLETQVEGEGLAPVLLTIRHYPWRDQTWHLRAGAGYVSHWISRSGDTSRKTGAGGMLGFGYDFVLNTRWAVTSFLTYSTGSAGEETFEAITLAIGLTYRIWPE